MMKKHVKWKVILTELRVVLCLDLNVLSFLIKGKLNNSDLNKEVHYYIIVLGITNKKQDHVRIIAFQAFESK